MTTLRGRTDRGRAKPGLRGGGNFFHVEVRRPQNFVMGSLGSTAVRVIGDRFKAKPRRNIPESEKPTPAMRRAQLRNIRKAQAARKRNVRGKRR